MDRLHDGEEFRFLGWRAVSSMTVRLSGTARVSASPFSLRKRYRRPQGHVTPFMPTCRGNGIYQDTML